VNRLIIAIDGPSGAGKGTVARTIAARLGYQHLDTGAMYRAVAWKARHDGRPLDDDAIVSEIARTAAIAVDGPTVSIDGHDVTSAIRTPDVDQAASIVARLPHVREALVARFREIGAAGGIVMEGRDIGTVVFPDADVKLYLDASVEERARRRATDAARGASQTGEASIAGVATALEARDRSDRTRAVAPLTLAPGAVFIDTTHLGVDEVVSRVMALVEGKLRG